MGLDKVSLIPASNPLPTEAPRCNHPVAHLQEEVALDEDRTTTCKDFTPTGASVGWQSGSSVPTGGLGAAEPQTSELVTITYLMEEKPNNIFFGGWGKMASEGNAVGVWTAVFKYFPFSNPSAQINVTGSNYRVLKMSSALIQKLQVSFF